MKVKNKVLFHKLLNTSAIVPKAPSLWSTPPRPAVKAQRKHTPKKETDMCASLAFLLVRIKRISLQVTFPGTGSRLVFPLRDVVREECPHACAVR